MRLVKITGLFVMVLFKLSGQNPIQMLDSATTYNSELELRKNRELNDYKYIIDQAEKKISFFEKGVDTPFKVIALSFLAPEANSAIMSPKNGHLVLYGEMEGSTRSIYFYSAKGEFLKAQNVNAYLSIKFSKDGDYIELFNLFGRIFSIYKANGDLVFKGDYIDDFIKANDQILYNIFFINDKILMSTSGNLYLYGVTEELTWNVFCSELVDARYYSELNAILIKTFDRNAKRGSTAVFCFQIRSIDDGALMEEACEVDQVYLLDETVVIKNKGQYYEYDVK